MFRIQSQAQVLYQENKQLKEQYNNLVQHANQLQKEVERLTSNKPPEPCTVHFLKQKNALLSHELIKKNHTIHQLNGTEKFVLTSCNSCGSYPSFTDTMSELTFDN